MTATLDRTVHFLTKNRQARHKNSSFQTTPVLFFTGVSAAPHLLLGIPQHTEVEKSSRSFQPRLQLRSTACKREYSVQKYARLHTHRTHTHTYTHLLRRLSIPRRAARLSGVASRHAFGENNTAKTAKYALCSVDPQSEKKGEAERLRSATKRGEKGVTHDIMDIENRVIIQYLYWERNVHRDDGLTTTVDLSGSRVGGESIYIYIFGGGCTTVSITRVNWYTGGIQE